MRRSATSLNLARLLGGVMIVRSLYALGLWGFAIAVRAGWLSTEPVLAAFFLNGVLLMLVPWLIYSLGYGVAGVLVWLNRPGAALICYGSAFAVDTVIWVAYVSLRLPDVPNMFWAAIVDLVTNLADLTILVILALLLVRRVQARPA